MNTLGYRFNDQWVTVDGLSFALRMTTTNHTLYSPDPALSTVETTPQGAVLQAGGLSWAGGQRTARGGITLRITRAEDGILQITGKGHADGELGRALVLLVRGLPIQRLISESDNMPDAPLAEKKDAPILTWPSRSATMPLVMIDCKDQSEAFALSRDSKVRFKGFSAFYDHNLGEPVLVLSHHEDARHRTCGIELPVWEIGRGIARGKVLARRIEDLERHFGMRPFEQHPERQWVNDISVIVNLHGVHSTGYVFLTYAQQADALRKVCKTIPGKQVLAFLPAWEGRYYTFSQEYAAAEELGGEQGLLDLVDTAHGLGVRVIPMLDGPNLATENYLRKNDLMDARLQTEYGVPIPQDWEDWNSDLKAEQLGWIVNFGHPGFCRKMVDLASGLIDRYHFDGIFLDGAIRWQNCPDYSPYEGLRTWSQEMLKRHPDTLLMGEDGYDLLWDLFGLFATSMQPLGIEQLMLRYTRQSWYLAYPAPGGSGGIHEQAWFSPTGNGQLSQYIIPTFSIVDDTLEKHAEEMKQALQNAARWQLAEPGYLKQDG